MFPVDPRLGKDYTRGAEQFLDRIKVGLFIPMHFWDNIEAAGAFRPAVERRGCRFAEIPMDTGLKSSRQNKVCIYPLTNAASCIIMLM